MMFVLGEDIFSANEICLLCLRKEKSLFSIYIVDNNTRITLASMISAIGSIPVSFCGFF